MKLLELETNLGAFMLRIMQCRVPECFLFYICQIKLKKCVQLILHA